MTARPQVWIETFREGLLSRVGHDLRFVAEDIAIEQDGERIEAVLPVRGLRLLGAVQGGAVSLEPLSIRDQNDILKNMLGTVLQADRYPHARFSGMLRPAALEGTLTLCGVSRPLRIPLRAGEGSIDLDQRDFGITPFRALMGTLRIQPQVRVRVRLSA